MLNLTWLDDDSTLFPPTEWALDEPNGLLAAGGDLSEQRLLAAYRQGIFPWFSDGQPILWWTPSPRMVLFPEKLHISRSLRKTLRQQKFQITVNHCFADVIAACAESRSKAKSAEDQGQKSSWITDSMKNAYIQLHQSGHAHSFEVWSAEQLVGGLYGIAIGQVFFGESMFSRMANTSKIAFVYLSQLLHSWGYGLIDCQVYSDHLVSLGAKEIAKPIFEKKLKDGVDKTALAACWQAADITDYMAF